MDTRLNSGEVELFLDGARAVLKPTARAALMISQFCGGLREAGLRLGRYDIETINFVIGTGLNLSDRDSKDLPDRIFRSGYQDLASPLIRFVGMLSNGGRPIDGDEERPGNEEGGTKA